MFVIIFRLHFFLICSAFSSSFQSSFILHFPEGGKAWEGPRAENEEQMKISSGKIFIASSFSSSLQSSVALHVSSSASLGGGPKEGLERKMKKKKKND